jgi:hypothetical protein
MDKNPEDDFSKQPAAQPAVRTSPEAAAAFKAALAQARMEGFAVTPTDLERLRLRAIPLVLAGRLAQMQDPTEIAEVLLAAINKALDDGKG